MLRSRARVSRLVLAAFLLGGSAVPLFAVELTAQQKQFLANIEKRLEQAKTNLKTAQDSAGSADKKPTASQTKLSLVRSAQARADLATVKEAAAKLPADDPAVKTLVDEYGKLEKAIDELEARLTGTANAGATPAAGAKLDYKQETLLKDARFFLGEVEGAANALDEIAARVKATKDVDSLDHRLLADAIATIEKAKGRKKSIDERLAQLPADGANVKATKVELDAAMARVDVAATLLTPVHRRLQKLIDPATYPELESDFKRVQGLGTMLGDSNVLRADPERAAQIASQRKAAGEELERVVRAYTPLVNQQTEAGNRIAGVTRFLAEKLAEFDRTAASVATALPGEIRDLLAKATKMADDAVTAKNPLYFTGGIPQQIARAESQLALLVTLDAANSKAIESELATTKKQLVDKQRSLRDSIIEQNELPADRYSGADKASLAERAIAAWKAKQPNAEVLAVRFPSDRWNRETMWRYQNSTWYLIDRSKLQAQLIVPHDDKLAVIRPIDLWIDHVDGDVLTAIPFHSDPAGELLPQDLLRIDKVK